MDEKELNKQVLDLIRSKSVLKRDVYELTKVQFASLKSELSSLAEMWKEEVASFDNRLEISYKPLGDFFCQLTIAGDILMFSMHTNVFKFDADSAYWKSSYLQGDETRGFCGTIQVYNFLADSFRFRRQDDVGYMLARLFINRDGHFFVEGKRRLGYLFNDFVNSELTPSCIRQFLMSVVAYTLNFDLYTPPYQHVQQVTVRDVSKERDMISLKTGKRLGFQLSSEGDDD